MQRFYGKILLLFFLLPVAAMADLSDSTNFRRWYIPHFVPVQFAGNIGLLSSGIGYVSNKENYELGILYGYVPAYGSQEPIHTITAKNVFPLSWYSLKSNQTLVPYLGLGLSLEIGGNAFFKLPDFYPDKYYRFPKAVHVIAFGGLKLQHLFEEKFLLFKGLEMYAEAGTVDVYIWYKAISQNVRFNQIFSLAVGVNLLILR